MIDLERDISDRQVYIDLSINDLEQFVSFMLPKLLGLKQSSLNNRVPANWKSI